MFINKNIYFDYTKLEKTIHNFYELIKLPIGVWDSNGDVFFGYPDNSSFCQKINTEYNDRKSCHRCDRTAAFKCNDTLKPYLYICHAGAHELVVPLVFEGKCRMYIVFGQFVCSESEELQRATMLRYCKNKGISSAILEAEFDKLPRLSSKYLDALANLAFLCFQTLWNNKTIEVRKEDILIEIDSYILENISSNLSVHSICANFHISKSTLYTLFKDYYKTTVNAYITQKRLEIAKELLQSSELSVTEISDHIGKNYNDFIQLFKKHELLSPTQYRKIHKFT